ncbi:hypothetical protein OsI_07198 [Oryza sativa Indica Group]|uniref:Uncharacterized protein n=1 Tax=Oryza sativa subsp. indica TaxID=39946 RepID=B8AHV6_ORYSI|nr:hypothetical protein OsI_07198 [Oryza sativa Indica Group]
MTTRAQTARASSSSFRRRASSSPIVQAGGAPRRRVEDGLQIGRGPGGSLEQRLGGGNAETVAVSGGEAQGDGPASGVKACSRQRGRITMISSYPLHKHRFVTETLVEPCTNRWWHLNRMKNDGNSTTDLSTQSGFFVSANALRCSREGASDAVGERGDDPGAWPYCFLSFASSSNEGHGDLLEQHGNSGWYKPQDRCT